MRAQAERVRGDKTRDPRPAEKQKNTAARARRTKESHAMPSCRVHATGSKAARNATGQASSRPRARRAYVVRPKRCEQCVCVRVYLGCLHRYRCARVIGVLVSERLLNTKNQHDTTPALAPYFMGPLHVHIHTDTYTHTNTDIRARPQTDAMMLGALSGC